MKYRNRRGELVEADSLPATRAKNELGSVLEKVIRGGVVVITKHDAPKAVLISVEDYKALSQATEVKLNTLSERFDAVLARMQSSKARAAMKAAFEASPKRLGKAARSAARKRG